MWQSRGTGINVFESEGRGCRASPPSLLFFSVWWRKRWTCEEGGSNTTPRSVSAPGPQLGLLTLINASTALVWGRGAADRWSALVVMGHWGDVGSSIRARADMSSQRIGPRKKGPSLGQWRAPQSGYGSVLTAIWLEIPLSSSFCRETRVQIYQVLSAVRGFHLIPAQKHI